MFDGELYASPRPAVPHARAAIKLAAKLDGPFDLDGPGGWIFLPEPELHFGADVLVPDLAGWRRERLPRLADEAYLTLAPDWVCEVLSPSTEALDRGKKLRIYAREGVSHVWLVNPVTETLEAYQLEEGRWTLLGTHAGDVEARVDPFEGVSLELWRLWGRSTPR
jgi:Uma2 family endonuclease